MIPKNPRWDLPKKRAVSIKIGSDVQMGIDNTLIIRQMPNFVLAAVGRIVALFSALWFCCIVNGLNQRRHVHELF